MLDLNSKTYVFKQTFDNNTPYFADRNLMISKDILQEHDIPEPKKEKDASVENRLRRIMHPMSNVGIRVIENDKNYFITLGKYQQVSGSYPMMGGELGGFSNFGGFTAFYNFTKEESLNFYLNKNDFSIALDDYIDPYERMEDFLDDILGYFDKKEKKYYLRKFNWNE